MIKGIISPLRPSYIIVCFALMWLGSCATNIKKDELVGHWEMSAYAVKLLGIPRDVNKRPKLTLHADGTFTAEDIPGKIIYRFKDQNSLFTGDGRWRIPQSTWAQGFSSLILRFDNVDGGDRAQPTLEIDDAGKNITIFTWAEEEGGERLEFHKLH